MKHWSVAIKFTAVNVMTKQNQEKKLSIICPKDKQSSVRAALAGGRGWEASAAASVHE